MTSISLGQLGAQFNIIIHGTCVHKDALNTELTSTKSLLPGKMELGSCDPLWSHHF